LGQNYPNPFNPLTVIRYSLMVNSYVTLKVYDLLGQEVKTLVDGMRDAGYGSVEWDGRDARGLSVPTGIYFVRMTAGEFNAAQKVMLMK
jgi:flagellar hook assembly protein FlgD